MSFKSIYEISNAIPLIFQYFVPGVVYIYIYNIFYKKKLSIANYWIVSGVITFILISLFEMIKPSEWDCSYLIRSAILIIVSFLLALVIGKINSFSWVRHITAYMFGRTFTQSIWDDVIDYKTGCYLNVYLKNKDYYINGTYDYSTEDSDDKWLSLIYFEKRNIADGEVICQSDKYRNSDKAHIVVRFDDIDYIEVDNDVA